MAPPLCFSTFSFLLTSVSATYRKETAGLVPKESVGSSEQVLSVGSVNVGEQGLEALMDRFTFVQTQRLVRDNRPERCRFAPPSQSLLKSQRLPSGTEFAFTAAQVSQSRDCWHLGPVTVLWGCPVRGRICCCISGLHPLDVRSTSRSQPPNCLPLPNA